MEKEDLHSFISNYYWLYAIVFSFSLLTTKFTSCCSPKAVSISKNIGYSSAYSIVVITKEDGIAITEFFSYTFFLIIYTAYLNKIILYKIDNYFCKMFSLSIKEQLNIYVFL